MTLSEEYLTFKNRELLDGDLADMIVRAFDLNYRQICDFFNNGELRHVTYVADPEYKAIAATYTEEARVVMNPEYYNAHTKDADSLTHELIHVAQNYWHRRRRDGSGEPRKRWKDMTEEERAEARRAMEERMPGWLTEGLADYGRDRFGVFNEEAGWALPAYSEKQKYTDAYRVTAAFLKWAEANGWPNLSYDLNQLLKKGEYRTGESWKALTGMSVDELWKAYAEANS